MVNRQPISLQNQERSNGLGVVIGKAYWRCPEGVFFEKASKSNFSFSILCQFMNFDTLNLADSKLFML